MIPQAERRSRPSYRTLAMLVYGAMTACAAIIAWARGESLVRSGATLPELDSLGASLGLGLGLALLMIALTRWIVLGTRWGRRLRDDFRALLAAATPRDAIGLALLSGIGEELLFRGALLPWWGLLASSLAFGILHVGPSRRFLGWTVWASALGACFGLITQVTGHLEGAMLAHVLINAVNLRFVLAFDGRLDTPVTEPGEQALVARRARKGTR
jgi:membrane protease YdiL (CAAX protease family)